MSKNELNTIQGTLSLSLDSQGIPDYVSIYKKRNNQVTIENYGNILVPLFDKQIPSLYPIATPTSHIKLEASYTDPNYGEKVIVDDHRLTNGSRYDPMSVEENVLKDRIYTYVTLTPDPTLISTDLKEMNVTDIQDIVITALYICPCLKNNLITGLSSLSGLAFCRMSDVGDRTKWRYIRSNALHGTYVDSSQKLSNPIEFFRDKQNATRNENGRSYFGIGNFGGASESKMAILGNNEGFALTSLKYYFITRKKGKIGHHGITRLEAIFSPVYDKTKASITHTVGQNLRQPYIVDSLVGENASLYDVENYVSYTSDVDRFINCIQWIWSTTAELGPSDDTNCRHGLGQIVCCSAGKLSGASASGGKANLMIPIKNQQNSVLRQSTTNTSISAPTIQETEEHKQFLLEYNETLSDFDETTKNLKSLIETFLNHANILQAKIEISKVLSIANKATLRSKMGNLYGQGERLSQNTLADLRKSIKEMMETDPHLLSPSLTKNNFTALADSLIKITNEEANLHIQFSSILSTYLIDASIDYDSVTYNRLQDFVRSLQADITLLNQKKTAPTELITSICTKMRSIDGYCVILLQSKAYEGIYQYINIRNSTSPLSIFIYVSILVCFILFVWYISRNKKQVN